jgi:phosphoglycerol transferase MdoB-like AlkP superfamily enzyme
MSYKGGHLAALKYLFREYLGYLLFWVAFFFASRLLFMAVNFRDTSGVAAADYFGILIHGLHMDFSMIGYLAMLCGLFFIVVSWVTPRLAKRFAAGVTLTFLIILSIVVISDAILFGYWGFRMDSTPLLYLKTPKEAAASLNIVQLISFPIAIGSYVVAWWFIYKKFVNIRTTVEARLPWWSILLIALNIIPIRGGFGISPMNPGKAYFSKNAYTNQATINVVWNVFYSLNKMEDTDREYNFMDIKEAQRIVADMYKQSGETEYILNTPKPNVIVLMMESFASNITETLGKEKGVTPNLDRLMREGVLFTHIYNDGQRSEKGLVSVLSGYPAQTTTSIIKHNAKVLKLPVLAKDFRAKGYSTAYYYGGDIGFANMRTYLISAGYDRYVTQDDFSGDQLQSKWGAQDEFVFNRLFDDLKGEHKPFFYTFFTSSSHEPFDVPMKTVIKGDDEDSKFMNAAHYTDRCLGDFIRKAKKCSWWNNTLIVLVADHGRSCPSSLKMYDEKRNRIPMLWLGGALKVKGVKIDRRGVQHDLAATLLSQLKMNTKPYMFSRNLLDKNFKDWSMFTFNNGFGYAEGNSVVVYDNVGNTYQQEINPTDEVKKKGKALFEVYNHHFVSL